MKTITNIKFNSVTAVKMGATAARINRETGDLQLSPDIWPKLPDFLKRYIEFHEWGHYVTKSDSEKVANDYANKNYIRPDHVEYDTKRLFEINNLLNSTEYKKLLEGFYSEFEDSAYQYSDFLGALIGGVAMLGSAILGKTSVDKASNTAASNASLNYQLELAKIADLKRQQEALFNLEQEKLESLEDRQSELILFAGFAIIALIGLVVFLRVSKSPKGGRNIIILLSILSVIAAAWYYVSKTKSKDEEIEQAQEEKTVSRPRTDLRILDSAFYETRRDGRAIYEYDEQNYY